MVHTQFDEVTKQTLITGESNEWRIGAGKLDMSKFECPDTIKRNFNELITAIETQYDRAYIKICAYDNKLYPRLRFTGRQSNYRQTELSFNSLVQDRGDHGSPSTCNYLKRICDNIIADAGVYDFKPSIVTKNENFLLAVAQTTIKTYLTKFSTDNKLSDRVLKCFREALVQSYSYLLMNPWTKQLDPVNFWEVGYFDSEFRFKDIRHLAIRRYAFPKTQLRQYVTSGDTEPSKQYTELLLDASDSVTLSLYIDAVNNKMYVWADMVLISERDYPLSKIYLEALTNDIPANGGRTTCLFDALFPLQRNLNDLWKVKHNRIKEYKGPVMVVKSASDMVIKSITNASGEFLQLTGDTGPGGNEQHITKMETNVIDPTVSSEAETIMTAMEKLANAAQQTTDLEQYRNAGQVIALKQIQDQKNAPQIALLSTFLSSTLIDWVRFNAELTPDEPVLIRSDLYPLKWTEFAQLLEDMDIVIVPAHNNVGSGEEDESIDVLRLNMAANYKFINDVLLSDASITEIPPLLHLDTLTELLIVRIKSLQQTNQQGGVEKLMGVLYQVFLKQKDLGNIEWAFAPSTPEEEPVE